NWVLTQVSASFNSIAYGAGKFVAGGGEFVGSVRTSSDGMTWTTPVYVYGMNGVFAFCNGQFVGRSLGGGVLVFADGKNWTQRSTGGWPVSTGAFGNGQFVAIGGKAILTSPNGSDWTLRQSGCQGQISQVTYVNTQFLALDDCGNVLSSADGLSWTP